jgi:hypothetical protein
MSFLVWFIEAVWTLSDEGSSARRLIAMLIFCFVAAAVVVIALKLL